MKKLILRALSSERLTKKAHIVLSIAVAIIGFLQTRNAFQQEPPDIVLGILWLTFSLMFAFAKVSTDDKPSSSKARR